MENASVIITLFIIFAPWVLLFLSKRKRKKIEANLAILDESRSTLEAALSQSESKLEKEKQDKTSLLEKYSSIIDMEKHVNELLDDANEEATSIKDQALLILAKNEQNSEDFKEEVKILNAELRQKLNDAKEKSTTITYEARQEANRIVNFANNQAEEIAGDAYEAKSKADSYEKAIRAMRNTIEGYKDDYIIPNHSVLDDLAEEYSHKDAGEQLKRARKRVRTMVKEGHAGECDYVEPYRKLNAIHFAVDAFNGKVDSALAKVKHDNFGKIKQEIIDSFALVNHNGAPFRNARITQEFLDVRLDELNWAVITHELRKKELEEQREIKQQIREEEKARREMEKAIKEAEKEEKLIQKALENARAELAGANEEQRQQYEAQLAELEGKLHEAEERGQRAISMAQQTRRGHVYVISNIGSFGEDVFKIGMTRRLEPLDRVKELGDASVPFSFDVHAMLYSDDAPALEKELHRKFELESVNKINYRKEFFRTSLAEIKQTVEQHGVTDAHWTMKSEATEYRESLAIEEKQKSEVAA